MPDDVTVYGIDFTSSPSRDKAIACLECRLVGDILETVAMHLWYCFHEFEWLLDGQTAAPPWIAGIDFPFGMPLRFVQNRGWPINWADYVEQRVEQLDRECWRTTLEDYKRHRPDKDKHHKRRTDIVAGGQSPQMLHGVPVALMFFEGVPRLRRAEVLIPGLQDGDPDRMVVEAYPAVAARNLVGSRKYKSESSGNQADKNTQVRELIVARLLGDKGAKCYGIRVQNTAGLDFVTDPKADSLDALLCSVQAAWAWRSGAPNFGLPVPISPTEGWIADPAVQ